MKRYWIGFTVVVVASFAVLGWVGTRIYQQAPPIASKVVTTDGTVFSRGTILNEARMFGKPWEEWRPVPYGATEVTLHRTGRPIGFIGKSMFILDAWAQETSWQAVFKS